MLQLLFLQKLFCRLEFLTLLLSALKSPDVDARGFSGFHGDFCATRPLASRCCVSRNDECTAPIRVPTGRVRKQYDTDGKSLPVNEKEMMTHLCYCDSFCRRDESQNGGNDCCPDYAIICENGNKLPPIIVDKAQSPPVYQAAQSAQLESFSASEDECFESGIAYGYGQTIRRNCQTCTCLGNRWKCDEMVCLIQETLIRKIRAERHTWTARNYSQFWGRTLDDGIRFRLGTLFPERSVENMNEILVRRRELPSQFDARLRWPALNVKPRDQGDCASSWAFSTTEIAADRLTILANDGVGPRVDLSVQQLIACNSNRQRGCQGGFLDRAWWYIRKLGLVSNDCYPYVSGRTRSPETCRVTRQSLYASPPAPACVGRTGANNTVYKMTPPYRISTREEDIRAEILVNGPVQATFLVYDDFFMYDGGVYRRMSTRLSAAGYHSVKILGWGDEPTTDGKILKYWICANSWGPNWGERGYFRIVRGKNHCEIESFVVGAWGKSLSEMAASAPSLPRQRTQINDVLAGRLQTDTFPRTTTSRAVDFWHYTRQPSQLTTNTIETTTTFTMATTETTTTETTTTDTMTTDTMTTTPTESESVAPSEMWTMTESTTTESSVSTTLFNDISEEQNNEMGADISLSDEVHRTVPNGNEVDELESTTIGKTSTITEGVDYLDEDPTTKSSGYDNTEPVVVTTTTTIEATITTEKDYDYEGDGEKMSTTAISTILTDSSENIDDVTRMSNPENEEPTEKTLVTGDMIAEQTTMTQKQDTGGSWADELEVPAGGITEFVGGTMNELSVYIDTSSTYTTSNDFVGEDTTSSITKDVNSEAQDTTEIIETKPITSDTTKMETSTVDIVNDTSVAMVSVLEESPESRQSLMSARIRRRLRHRKRKRRQKNGVKKGKKQKPLWKKQQARRRERHQRNMKNMKYKNDK